MQDAAGASSNLIWIDLEMTGLDTQTDHIIEIATLVTDVALVEIDTVGGVFDENVPLLTTTSRNPGSWWVKPL